MSTTAPRSSGVGSTTVDAFVSFDEDQWLEQVPENGVDLPSIAPPALGTEPTTTKESFGLPDLLIRRYRRDWPREKRPRFTLKQEWIGRVDEVYDDVFLATLVTRAAPEDVEHAEIELEEVSPSDRDDLRPGAVFYWVIGYRDEPYGQRVGVSSVIVRKMSDPTPDQLEEADAEAQKAITFLAGGGTPSPTD